MQRQGQAGKMLVPLLGIFTALAMGVAAFAILQWSKEREVRQARERDLHFAQAEKEELKTRMGEIQDAKSKADDELLRIRKEFTQLKDDLAQAMGVKDTLSRSVEDREKEITRLTKELEQAQQDSKRVTTQVTDLQNERDAIKQQLADLEQAKGQLEAKVMELTERPTVELEKVTVGGETRAAAGSTGTSAATAPASAAVRTVSASTNPTGSGQIVVVNREYDFVVVNMGKNQGLTVGQECQILRDNQVLGRVKLEKVYDELSAAAILPESKKDSIREGDLVKVL